MLLQVSGAGCRLYEFNLASRRERLLPVPHPTRSSDTTPSMWRGEVVFARMSSAHRHISEVMLWSPHHTLRTLPGGKVPDHCAGKGRCQGQPVAAEVQGLDLKAQTVSFTWSIGAPGIVGHDDWEVRVDNLADDQGSMAGEGIEGEACVGGGLEVSRPETPVSVGKGTLFTELDRSECYRASWSRLRSPS